MTRFLFTIILLVGLSLFDKSVQGEEGTTYEHSDPNYLKTNESEALFTAIKAGKTDVVISLIENGTNLHTVDEIGHSYLQYAVIYGKTEIVKILFEHGANLSTETYDSCDNTALHWSAVNGKVETADLLLKHGAKLNAINCKKRTPLGVAVLFGNTQLVEFFIKHGAELNIEDFFGPIMIIEAAGFGHLDVCKILIANGANTSEAYMSYALFVASVNGTKELAEYLIDMGANVNHELRKITPLHNAFLFDNEEVKNVLIHHGADLNAKDRDNKTPREMDIEEGRKFKADIFADIEKYREGKVVPI